jgi:cytidine deaminase
MVKTKTISFAFTEYSSIDELENNDRELVDAARDAAVNAYAPYSLFRVGAAVRLSSGIIVRGANVENAAFPSGVCAERNALANCVSNYREDKPVAISIAAMSEDGFTENPVPPCGNCRQVITEEETRNKNKIKVILAGRNKIQVIESCSHLLPLQFTKENLSITDLH